MFIVLPLLGYVEFRCPECGAVYDRSIFRHKVRLGPGHATCKPCAAEFDDSSREWVDLFRYERIRYLFPMEVRVSLVLATGLVLLFVLWGFDALLTVVVVGGLLSLPVCVFSAITAWQVRRSISRKPVASPVRNPLGCLFKDAGAIDNLFDFGCDTARTQKRVPNTDQKSRQV